MEILSKAIQGFIEQIKTLNDVGCLLVPQADRDQLLSLLNKADLIIGKEVQPDRVTYYVVEPKRELPSVKKPALLVVAEEDFASDPQWAERLRAVAAYFLNVRV